MLLHGGAWSARYDLSLMAALVADLAARGWAVWNLEYRRVGRRSGGGWPQTGEDVLAGIDLLAQLDAPLDLERVVVIGHSAGGQLALWAAGRRRAADVPVRVRAAVAQAGVVDLEAAARHGSSEVLEFLGGDPGEVPGRYADASPTARLPLGVPQLLVHGEAGRRCARGVQPRATPTARGRPVTA